MHVDTVRARHAADQAERDLWRQVAREVDGPPAPGMGAILKQALTATRTHVIDIVPAGKMDTPNLVAAVCSCGTYRSCPGSENASRKSGDQHVAAKTARYRPSDNSPQAAAERNVPRNPRPLCREFVAQPPPAAFWCTTCGWNEPMHASEEHRAAIATELERLGVSATAQRIRRAVAGAAGLTAEEKAEAECIMAGLYDRGYRLCDRFSELQAGARVRHVGHRWPEAGRVGTGVIVVVLERNPSSWSQSHRMPDVEMIVAYDKPTLPDMSRLVTLAQYHVSVVAAPRPSRDGEGDF